MARPNEVGELLGGVERMLKAVGRRVGHCDPEDLARLIGLRSLLNETIQEAVDGLRADGFTWQSIGDATGTTAQAAVQKWGPGRRSA